MTPRLRAGIIVAIEESSCRIEDPVLDRNLKFGPGETEVLRAMSAGGELAALLALPEGEKTLRHLMLLNLLEGAGAAIVDKVAKVKTGEVQVPYSILEGARFSCQGSGECCQNYVFGPLEDVDVARLVELESQIREAFPDLATAPFVEEKTTDGGRSQRYLSSRDDRCVFLGADNLCRLHARFGADSKPKLCRLYPMEQLATIDGVRVYDRGTCASFASAVRKGLPMADDLAAGGRLRSLLPSMLILHHPVVYLGGENLLADYGWWLLFGDRAIDLARSAPGGAAGALRAMGRMLDALSRALATCPIEPGQPDRTVDDLLGQGAEAWSAAPDPDAVKRAADALEDVCADVLSVVTGVIMRSNSDGQRWFSARLLREVAQLFHIVQHGAAVAAGMSDVPDIESYREMRGVTATPEEQSEMERVLRTSLRQQVFGFGALVDGDASAGLLRMALTQLLAVQGARLRALTEARVATADDLSYGHMRATRVLSMSGAEMVLKHHRQKAALIVEALPTLAALPV